MGASLVPGGGFGAVLLAALPIALTAGVAGALAELYSHKLEDNFAIPLAVAAATSLWTL
jgi:dolichol kinase